MTGRTLGLGSATTFQRQPLNPRLRLDQAIYTVSGHSLRSRGRRRGRGMGRPDRIFAGYRFGTFRRSEGRCRRFCWTEVGVERQIDRRLAVAQHRAPGWPDSCCRSPVGVVGNPGTACMPRRQGPPGSNLTVRHRRWTGSYWPSSGRTTGWNTSRSLWPAVRNSRLGTRNNRGRCRVP